MSSETASSDRIYDILAWLEIHKQKLAYGAVAVLVVGFGMYAWSTQRQETELKANEALLRLRPGSDDPKGPPAAKVEDFLKVADAFSGTGAAERALLLAGAALFQDQKYAEAQQQFERFLSRNSGNPLTSEALYGKATSLEAQGKTNDAFNVYQEVFTRYASSSAAGQAKLALARLYESRNQPEAALKLYNDLAKPTLTGGWAGEAAQRRTRLYAAHPHLQPTLSVTNTVTAGTNAPAQPVPAAAAAGQ
jgi:tetratricopeptide (TPR) repeat protein